MDKEQLFEAWLLEVDQQAIQSGYDHASYTEDSGGKDTWRGMYDDGLTPAEAWREEIDAAISLGC